MLKSADIFFKKMFCNTKWRCFSVKIDTDDDDDDEPDSLVIKK